MNKQQALEVLHNEMQRAQSLILMLSNAKDDLSLKQLDAISNCFFDSNEQMIGEYYKIKDAN